jgi:hypothetical protein
MYAADEQSAPCPRIQYGHAPQLSPALIATAIPDLEFGDVAPGLHNLAGKLVSKHQGHTSSRARRRRTRDEDRAVGVLAEVRVAHACIFHFNQDLPGARRGFRDALITKVLAARYTTAFMALLSCPVVTVSRT